MTTSRLSRWIDRASSAVVIGALFVAVASWIRSVSPVPASSEEVVHATAGEESRTPGRWLGSKDASVVVTVYSDYACGFCASLDASIAILMERYPEHLGVEIKHFTARERGPRFDVVLGAECAGDQGFFEQYHRAAFSGGRLIDYARGWLMLADSVGIPDRRRFEDCVRSREHASRVSRHAEEATNLGFDSTPSMLLNGKRIVGAPPPEVLDSRIASEFPGRSSGVGNQALRN